MKARKWQFGLGLMIGLATLGSNPVQALRIDVREAGVPGDGKAVQTGALQAAIDRVAAAGGGEIYFPPGVYVTGTLTLRSNLTLHLAAGAVLRGSEDVGDYTPQHLLQGEGVEHLAILGSGTIDGRGQTFWVPRTEGPAESRRYFSWIPGFAWAHPRRAPGRLVKLEGCKDVVIRDVTLTCSESWTLSLSGCEDVRIDGIRILNPLIGPNTDGIDLNACQNVTLSNAIIYTGDDGICLKNEDPEYEHLACKNITVTNCIVTTTCNGFKIGTGTYGDFENITVSNCVFKAGIPGEPMAAGAAETVHPRHEGNALGPLSAIALESVDGGTVRGVTVSNIVIQGARAPIFLRLGNRGGRDARHDPERKPGKVEDIIIRDVVAYGVSLASPICGIPGAAIENVAIENFIVHTAGGGTAELAAKVMEEKIRNYPEATMWGPLPAYGLVVRHAKNVSLRNVQVFTGAPDARPLLLAEDVEGLELTGLRGEPGKPREEIRRLQGVSGLQEGGGGGSEGI